jgi:hypothetical protein
MRGAIPPLSQYVFMAWYLVKHRNNFTFIFLGCENNFNRSSRTQNVSSSFEKVKINLSLCLTKYDAMKTYPLLTRRSSRFSSSDRSIVKELFWVYNDFHAAN